MRYVAESFPVSALTIMEANSRAMTISCSCNSSSFIDAWISPESGKNLIEMYGYGSGNSKSFDLVDPSVLDDLGISDPMTMMANSRFFGEIEPDVREKYINLFDEIKAGF